MIIIIKYLNIDFTQIIIIKDVPNHLSDLKAIDDSIFLSECKCYSIFLHHSIHHLILYNTNSLISNNIYKDNHLSGCVYPIINFVLDLSKHTCYQKDSKLVCFVSEQLNCEHLNG